MKNLIENNDSLGSRETKSYYWLSFDGLKYIISMNPVEHLESERTRIENKSQFLIDNRQQLCEHGGLHPMIARNSKYIPGKLYNYMKETFIKNWESKIVLGFNSSKEIPKFTNHEISERNMRCYICIKELWHDISGKVELLKELHFIVRALKKT